MPKSFRIKIHKISKIYSNKFLFFKMKMRALCCKTHFHAFSNPIFKNKKTTQKYLV